jgi:hypothetical protein
MHSLKYLEDGLLPPIQTFKNSTICFIDIVSYSKKCELLTPEKIVEWMTNFHEIINKYLHEYHIQKIETKGDSYLCISGTNYVSGDLETNQVSRMINFCKKIIKNLDNTNVRIGIHCGSVTIAHLCITNPIKTAYGDDVNIAARMEQSCKDNLIHLTKKAAEIYANENNLILDASKCCYTTYKNIIKMETYLFDI